MRAMVRWYTATVTLDVRAPPSQGDAVPQRNRYLFVCTNRRPDGNPKGSCAARGSVEIHAALQRALFERGLNKVEARACTSGCLDTCWAGPSIAVQPDNYFYGRVTLADVPEIVDALARGGRVERLVLPPEDFDEKTARPPLAPPAPAPSTTPAAPKEPSV
jgi:(2Fe-2S) ferredoxin